VNSFLYTNRNLATTLIELRPEKSFVRTHAAVMIECLYAIALVKFKELL
jgi:hypothetical protein